MNSKDVGPNPRKREYPNNSLLDKKPGPHVPSISRLRVHLAFPDPRLWNLILFPSLNYTSLGLCVRTPA
jgi:hypothetical protein